MSSETRNPAPPWESASKALRSRIELHYEIRAEAVARGRATPRYAAEVFINSVLGLLSGAELAGFPVATGSHDLVELASLRVRQLYPDWDAYNTARGAHGASLDITVTGRL